MIMHDDARWCTMVHGYVRQVEIHSTVLAVLLFLSNTNLHRRRMRMTDTRPYYCTNPIWIIVVSERIKFSLSWYLALSDAAAVTARPTQEH